jgi:hypothetical protein
MTMIEHAQEELSGYGGNPRLKSAGVKFPWEKWQIEEFRRCARDPIYFCEKYVKIVDLDKGIVNFKLRDFQKRIVKAVKKNRFTIIRCGRQMGKTTTAAALMLHEGLFVPNSYIAVLANKMDSAQEVIERIQMAYENLPLWMQQGVLSWNKRSIMLENGSKFICAPTSADGIRGKSISMLYLDEFAHINPVLQQKFFTSTYPVITSGTKTKIIITSTPNGMDLFYKLWTDAVNKRNSYTAVDVHWSEIPGRDEKWKEETIANTSEEQFRQEYEVEFLGSSNTLLSPNVLQRLTYNNPIEQTSNISVYKQPEKDSVYTIIADTARGTIGDYSAFLVINITRYPVEVVAVFRDNAVLPVVYPDYIHRMSKYYNDAYVLVETNDIGGQVVDILMEAHENENILVTTHNGRKGQVLGSGHAGKSRLGVRTTGTVKRIGCLNLKSMIEKNRIILNDFNIIQELSTFISKGGSYQAEYGKNDDLVMCLVLFAWMATQDYFKQLTNTDFRKDIMSETEKYLEEDLLPFGIINDGRDDDEEITVWNEDKQFVVNMWND